MANDILNSKSEAGKSRETIKTPNAALWLAPIMPGSIKRFLSTICNTIPATLSVAPTRIMASVRGIRLIKSKLSCSDWLNMAFHSKSPTPMDKLHKLNKKSKIRL